MALNELLRQWKRTKDEAENVTQREQTVETIYTLCSNTYRAHQVISEVKNNYWGSASEERITHIKARIHDASFCKFAEGRIGHVTLQLLSPTDIFLFDRERMFHKQRQIFETEYINSGSRGVLHKIFGRAASVPISRLIKADDRVLIGTFLTNFNGELSPPVLMPQRTRFGPNLVAETATLAGAASHCSFGDSTRQQFLGHLSNLGPLVHPEREENDALPLLQIHLTFAKIMARDWDLVLSQMGQTLDDIDRKISDNTELRENVLSWRRLLGSWRMIIIEYKAKLAETHQFLKSQTSHKHTAVYNIPFPGETSQRHTPDSITNPFNVGSTEYEVDDIIFSYEILEDAIKVIEGRVDKSFQALMSSMSILESQKAITQGSAVARLTELAFIFIPLNFASTFFSMQIKVCNGRCQALKLSTLIQVQEFQGNSAPTIGAFFALAVPLMLFLYTLRGFIRSSLLKSIRHHLDSKIRETSKIPGTSEIPTRVIVSFGWRQLGSFSRALLIVVPLAMVLLSLIIRFGQWLPFRILGAVVTIIGTAIITLLLAIESYVPALQVGVIIGWVLSMLGIGFGQAPPSQSVCHGGPLYSGYHYIFHSFGVHSAENHRSPSAKVSTSPSSTLAGRTSRSYHLSQLFYPYPSMGTLDPLVCDILDFRHFWNCGRIFQFIQGLLWVSPPIYGNSCIFNRLSNGVGMVLCTSTWETSAIVRSHNCNVCQYSHLLPPD